MALRNSLDNEIEQREAAEAEAVRVLSEEEIEQLLLQQYEQDELTNMYINASRDVKKQLMNILDDERCNYLRLYYLQRFRAQIQTLDEMHPAKVSLFDLHDEIKANKLDKHETFDVLHHSIDLVTKPDLHADRFATCITDLKKTSKSNFRWGIAYSVLAGLLIAGAVAITTLNYLGILTSMSHGMAIALSIMEGLHGLNNSWKAFSMFKNYRHEKSMLGKMEAVNNAYAPQPQEEVVLDGQEGSPLLLH